jgi:hypothetical protein
MTSVENIGLMGMVIIVLIALYTTSVRPTSLLD